MEVLACGRAAEDPGEQIPVVASILILHASILFSNPASYLWWDCVSSESLSASQVVQEVRKFKYSLLAALGLGLTSALYGAELKEGLLDTFTPMAVACQRLPWYGIYVCVALLMVVRVFVTTPFPPSSPVFALLVTLMLPPSLRALSPVFLLLGSIPGGLTPLAFDSLLLALRPKQGPLQATRFFQSCLDYLPFANLVNPAMKAVFMKAREAGKSSSIAGALAVTAGHLMIWTGGPTTLLQRQYVANWQFAAFIQPLGLLEDVAVSLASWAGSTPEDAKLALAFMLLLSAAAVVVRRRFAQPPPPPLPEDVITAIPLICAATVCLWVWASSGPSAEPSAGPSAGPHDAKITLNVGVIVREGLIYATTLLLARLLGKLCAERWWREPEQGTAPLLRSEDRL